MPATNQVTEFFSKYPIESDKRGKQLILIGDSVHEVIYVESGRIDQYDIGASGDKAIINTFGPGAFLPMSNVLNDLPSEYFFEISSPKAEIRRAPAAEVVAFLHSHPMVVLDLLSRVYRGLDGMLARLSSQMSGTAQDRIWRQLVINGRRFGMAADRSGYVKLKITENQLAQQTGLARETVSRELKKFRLAGTVELPRQGEMLLKLD